MVPHLIVPGLPTPRRECCLNDDMNSSAAHTHLSIAIECVNPRLCPVGQRSRVSVSAVVQVDAGIGVITGKHVANAATSRGAWVLILPLFESYREGIYAILECSPGLSVRGTGTV